MPPTRRAVLGTTVGTLAAALAGCTGTSDEGGDGTPTATATATATETARTTATETATAADGTSDGTATADVRTRSHSELGTILVDGEGMTLYMWERDTQGEMTSACTGDCASAWPPLTVEDGDVTAASGVNAEVTTFEREDGGTQVAANGWPLYRFADDQDPGDATGQGVGDVWWVLDPDGRPVKPDSGSTGGSGGGY